MNQSFARASFVLLPGAALFLSACWLGAVDELCVDINATAHVGYRPISGTILKSPSCACGNTPAGCICAQTSSQPCSTGYRCYQPILGGVQYEPLPAGCDPTTQACGVRASVAVQWPGNSQSFFLLGGGGSTEP